MKKCAPLLLTVMLLMAAYCNAQPKPAPVKHFKTLHFYTYGLQAFPDDNPGNCYQEVQKRYSIAYKRKAGCVVSHARLLRYQLHNVRIEKKERKRFGDNWYEEYRKALAACGTQT